ncbi:MAG: RluA family pseudouridine synthase [Bacilli bacterium]|nr:RluA family pseudouridine synthase [Bacilli bacterium]MBN2695968.1 RluA family pseudouridine synthase [Bacilli bacterium]
MTRQDFVKIPIEIGLSGLSVEAVLADFCLAKAKIKALANAKALFLNGRPVSLDNQVSVEDILELDVSSLETLDYLPDDLATLKVLYEDDWVYVLEKQPGMIIHPDDKNKHGTLANVAALYLKDRKLDRSVRYLHRLDKDTSGAVLFASHVLAHSYLNAHWNHVDIKREYVALVEGILRNASGKIDLPIGNDRHNSNRYIVSRTGKSAVTNYSVLKTYSGMSLVSLWLETGRTHQIRVHFAHLGHPVLGDSIYGAKLPGIKRIMLHSAKIGFIHPLTRRYVEVESPMPEDFFELSR